jgi:hypothetical protein
VKQLLRAGLILLAPALLAGASSSPPALAATACPTQTFLSFDHLAYASVGIPANVRLPAGRAVGDGAIDEPASADGCRRKRTSVHVLAAGTIEPAVAVLTAERPHLLFVIGHRCAGSRGPAYWSCLLHPLVFHGRRFTGTSYPATPPPRGTVPLGGALGSARLDGATVTVRRIAGVEPAIAVAVAGRPSEAFLAAPTCPYEGFSNTALDDDLLRCLRSPVWFTFDPPGNLVGGSVVARSDRLPGAAVAGASIGLARLQRVANVVPADHAGLAPIGRVAREVGFTVPDVPAGLYEAVVTCRRCAAAARGRTLFPAGSILITSKPKTSTAIRLISYGLTVALIALAILTVTVWVRRRRGRRAAPPAAGGS